MNTFKKTWSFLFILLIIQNVPSVLGKAVETVDAESVLAAGKYNVSKFTDGRVIVKHHLRVLVVSNSTEEIETRFRYRVSFIGKPPTFHLRYDELDGTTETRLAKYAPTGYFDGNKIIVYWPNQKLAYVNDRNGMNVIFPDFRFLYTLFYGISPITPDLQPLRDEDLKKIQELQQNGEYSYSDWSPMKEGHCFVLERITKFSPSMGEATLGKEKIW